VRGDLGADDRAEVTVLDAEGGEDAAALGARADAPASGTCKARWVTRIDVFA